jgi:hypothetical protein
LDAYSEPSFVQRGRGVSYTDVRKKFWNSVPACVLLINNFWNGVLVLSITKIPLVVGILVILLP